jgi:hypothetical protein
MHLSRGNQGDFEEKPELMQLLVNDLESALADRRSVRDLHELKSTFRESIIAGRSLLQIGDRQCRPKIEVEPARDGQELYAGYS